MSFTIARAVFSEWAEKAGFTLFKALASDFMLVISLAILAYSR